MTNKRNQSRRRQPTVPQRGLSFVEGSSNANVQNEVSPSSGSHRGAPETFQSPQHNEASQSGGSEGGAAEDVESAERNTPQPTVTVTQPPRDMGWGRNIIPTTTLTFTYPPSGDGGHPVEEVVVIPAGRAPPTPRPPPPEHRNGHRTPRRQDGDRRIRGPRPWNEKEYFPKGFMKNTDGPLVRPECYLCRGMCIETGANIKSNESMKHIKRHFTDVHCKNGKVWTTVGLQRKKQEYLQLKREIAQRRSIIEFGPAHFELNKKKTSHRMAFLKAQLLMPYNTFEEFGKESLRIILEESGHGELFDKLTNFPSSPNTMRRNCERIHDYHMVTTVRAILKSPFPFTLQIDESTDCRGKSQLVGFVRYIDGYNVEERIVFCYELEHRKTAHDITEAVRKFMEKHDIPWHKLGSVSTDGATTNTGPHTGVIRRLTAYSPNLTDTSCFIHRYVLCIKKIRGGLAHAFNTIKEVATFFKGNKQVARDFRRFCKEKNLPIDEIPYYTEVRWLSLGKLIARIYKYKADLVEFLTRNDENDQERNVDVLEKKRLLAFQLTTPVFEAYLAFFTDVLPVMDKVTKDLQGKKRTVAEAEEKIRTFKGDVVFWRCGIRDKRLDDLPTLKEYLNNQTAEARPRILGAVRKDILKYLTNVYKLLKDKFPTLHEVQYWMIDPLNVVDTQLPSDPMFRAAIDEMRANESIEIYFKQARNPLDFWANARALYPNISSAAIKVLLPFVTTYRCEAAFSRLKLILSDRRTRAHVEALLICGCIDYEPVWEDVVRHVMVFNSH